MKTTGKTTAQCLKALLDSDEAEPHKLLSFVGAGQGQVPRWLRSKGPQGFYLLRLRVYLAERGFVPVELETIKDEIFGFARGIAHRLIKDEQVPKELGLNMNSALCVMHGKAGTSDRVLEKMKVYNQLFAGDLPAMQPLKGAPAAPQNGQSHEARPAKPIPKDLVFRTLAQGIGMLRPYAEMLASSEYSDEERKQFRVLCGYDNLSKTSTALNQLLRC